MTSVTRGADAPSADGRPYAYVYVYALSNTESVRSNCGCCWAFAAAEAATDRMCIATNGTLTMPLSAQVGPQHRRVHSRASKLRGGRPSHVARGAHRQDVCFCGSDSGCDGGMLPDAWDFIQETGVVTGAQQTGALRNDDPFGDGGAPLLVRSCSQYLAGRPAFAERRLHSNLAGVG